MKIITDKKIYQCDFCNLKRLVAWAVKKHEKDCSKNPQNNRACFGIAKRSNLYWWQLIVHKSQRFFL